MEVRLQMPGHGASRRESGYLLIERKRACVGGLNLLPRGILYNTENGISIEDDELAQQLESMRPQLSTARRRCRPH